MNLHLLKKTVKKWKIRIKIALVIQELTDV
jgi:hypothetical protein